MRYLGQTLLHKAVFLLLVVIGITAGLESFAQSLEFTLNPRRRFDQIHVEIWAKGLPAGQTTIPKIGFASLIVKYNNAFLQPITDANQALIRNTTDSISSNVDQNPVIAISSQFHSANGYDALGSQGYGVGTGEAYYSLEVALTQLGTGGLAPDTNGRGSFIGRIAFQILASGNPDTTSLTNFGWGDAAPGGIILKDINNNNIKSQTNFVAPAEFKVLGVVLLSPLFNGTVIDRDKHYAALTSPYAPGVGQSANGYPIYFERSVNPNAYTGPVDENLGYKFEYSLDSGKTWTEFARIAETNQTATAVGANPQYVSGSIFPTTGATVYPITTQAQAQIAAANYRDPLRIIWKSDLLFTQRSEAAKIRITQLVKKSANSLASRANENMNSQSPGLMILGRLFFVQMNGQQQYLRTPGSFSNSTQLTVEAWVNLSPTQPFQTGLETGLVVSSGGPDATQVNGSKEGTWMLYLKDGKYPAFRARDILGRGTGGYLASIIAYDSTTSFSSDKPLQDAHAGNWTHIAATVNKNEVILYVDGEKVERIVNTETEDMRMNITSHPIWIGVNPNDSLHGYLSAGIKGVRVWRIALSQDEIRQRVAGIADPTGAVTAFTPSDLRKGMQLYYKLEGDINDAASETSFQEGAENAQFYVGTTLQTSSPEYRPDKPHIRLTAPAQYAGVKNKTGELFELRWISYGIGTLNNSSDDIEFQYSIDNGTSWGSALGSTGLPLSSVNLELGKINWEPFRSANLITSGSKSTLLRARGIASNQQTDIAYSTGKFTVAPYFAAKMTNGVIIALPGDQGMNISGTTVFLEAWIQPERFPTDAEGTFPIVSKIDSVSGLSHYSFSLLPSGQLEFEVTNSSGTIHRAVSDTAQPVLRPNSVSSTGVWSHVAVYAFLNPTGASEVKFYIDGTPQNSTAIATQLGNNLTVNTSNKYPTYLGYAPSHLRVNPDGTQTQRTARNFVGLIREIRFWSGAPNDASASGNEPTAMTRFVQGAQAVRAENLTQTTYNKNLNMSFSMNLGTFVHQGYNRAIGASYNGTTKIARHYGVPVEYVSADPYIKLVEPTFKQLVKRTKSDVKVRWVGFDYDGLSFSPGAVGTQPALEFSTEGGGGGSEFYKYVGGPYFTGQTASIYWPNPVTDSYRFDGTGSNLYYAFLLNANLTDPDVNDNGGNVQGAISPSLTNARFRLTGKYNINGQGVKNIRSEGPLFTVTPGSNFTIRMLLEGYHRGSTQNITNIGSTFNDGGIKITLYEDNSGVVGNAVAQGESTDMYANLVTTTRGNATSQFANVYFVFDSIPDGNYWVKVEHLNHLSVMSRYPAPFKFTGDELTTWAIESGWDFQTWGGNPSNVVADATTNPWTNRDYTAKGTVVSPTDKSNPNYSTLGLAYNDGAPSTSINPMPALVGGDVVRDGVINADDRAQVRNDDGTHLERSDVNGDGDINATDRSIVDRNFGKVSSIYSFEYPTGGIVKPSDTELAENNVNNNINELSFTKTLVNGKGEELQANLNYKVSADVEANGKFIDLHFFIENTGTEFNLANATFAVKYSSNHVKFVQLYGQQSVAYSNVPSRGYSEIRTAPRPDAESPVPDVRTLEIDYDAYSNLGGLPVPTERTYLGSLRFEVTGSADLAKFEWYKSTVLYSVSGENITNSGIYSAIGSGAGFSAAIVNPKSGDVLRPKIYHNIAWTSEGLANVIAQYSTDGGNNWVSINSEPIGLSSNGISWLAPDVFSSVCYVRLLEATSGSEICRSGIFTIKPVNYFAQILKPSSGDKVYTGGTTGTIVWNSEGYNKLKFEFSPDFGLTWQNISANVQANKGTLDWKLPNVTSKTALVRMIDEETGKEIAISSTFKILNGSLEFRSPRDNERLVAGKQTRIRWTPVNVTNFDLDISYDGGLTWFSIDTYVDADQTYMNWTVPNMPTTKGIIRAIWLGDSEMEYARTGQFTIEPQPSFVGEELPEGWTIGNVSPNPVNNLCVLEIGLPSSQIVNIVMYNAAGVQVMSKDALKLNSGNNRIEINTSELPAGAYYLSIKTSETTSVRALQIVK